MKINKQIETTLASLYKASKYDQIKMARGALNSIFRPMKASDFKDVYLSISEEQGEDIVQIIKDHNFKNIVEFGTSFGISTLFLAQAALETNGNIISTELLDSKAKKAIENFKKAGVNELIETRIGNALVTLKNHNKPIDFLLLDGWKNLYLPLFQMLEPNFKSSTIIYVDNADMFDSKKFIASVSTEKYQIESRFNGKVALIKIKE